MVRVYELAKELGVESKAVMVKLQEMGEFVRSASSTIEAPVVRRLKEAFAAKAAEQNQQSKARSADGAQAATPGLQAQAQAARAARAGQPAPAGQGQGQGQRQ